MTPRHVYRFNGKDNIGKQMKNGGQIENKTKYV
jgi:hypothetical protein